MASLGLPQGYEVFQDVKEDGGGTGGEVDFDDSMSLGSIGDMSLLTLGSTLESDLPQNPLNNHHNNSEKSIDLPPSAPPEEDDSKQPAAADPTRHNSHSGAPQQHANQEVHAASNSLVAASNHGPAVAAAAVAAPAPGGPVVHEAPPESEPRMVSADSMATVRHANVKPPPHASSRAAMADSSANSFLKSSQTPYDSLKDLVKSKKRQRPTQLPPSSSSAALSQPSFPNGNSHTTAPNSSSTGMVSRPSTFLRQALYGSRAVVPQPNQDMLQEAKRSRLQAPVQVTNPLLHKACMKHGVEADVIEAILKIDRNLASKTQKLYQTRKVYDCVKNIMVTSKVKEKYGYPLNIAIKNGAKEAAVELLVRACPRVAALADGPMKECSLFVLLKHNPQNAQLADLLLLSNPSCARTRDCHQNTPLHIACQYGASLAIVKHICILYPPSLKVKNRFGQTPLHVAQRAIRSSAIATYLSGKQRGIFS